MKQMHKRTNAHDLCEYKLLLMLLLMAKLASFCIDLSRNLMINKRDYELVYHIFVIKSSLISYQSYSDVLASTINYQSCSEVIYQLAVCQYKQKQKMETNLD